MKSVCLGAILSCLAILVLPTAQSEVANEESVYLPPWWGQVFGVQPRVLRADKGKSERFWATRGKRSVMSIKPNGLFQPISWKRSKPALKPNGFFMMGKRSSLKPNSLFSMTQGKRTISLKPNGLFSLTKRSGDGPLIEEMYPKEYIYDQFWGVPSGIFGNYKRSMKPNGLFSIGKRSYDYDYDVDDVDNEDIMDIDELETDDNDDFPMVKREPSTFWATRGKRGEMFWATRGKRGENFWAARG